MAWRNVVFFLIAEKKIHDYSLFFDIKRNNEKKSLSSN